MSKVEYLGSGTITEMTITQRAQNLERTRIVLSSAPVARSLPSGLKHTLLMYKSFALSAVSSARTLHNDHGQHQTSPQPRCTQKLEPSFGASLSIIYLGGLIAARCQILAICGKPDTTNDTKHKKWSISPTVPLTLLAEGGGATNLSWARV